MIRTFMAAAAVVLALPLVAQSAPQDFLAPAGPRNPVRVDQRLGQQLPLDLQFRDESGKTVRLRDYFDGRHPVLLNFVYFSCPMLCNMVLDGTTTAVSNIKLEVGKDYQIVTVSFDPRDTPQDAAEKKRMYIRRYGRPGADEGWHFLTGAQAQISELTDAAGFRYQWDPKSQQFAHGTTIMTVTPQGKLSRYFYGIEYPARDLRLGLVEASDRRIGSPTDQILLLCFHYDPATGRYSKVTMNLVRAGGVATVFGLAGFIFLAVRRERMTIERRDQ